MRLHYITLNYIIKLNRNFKIVERSYREVDKDLFTNQCSKKAKSQRLLGLSINMPALAILPNETSPLNKGTSTPFKDAMYGKGLSSFYQSSAAA